jgi:hypothetical protein
MGAQDGLGAGRGLGLDAGASSATQACTWPWLTPMARSSSSVRAVLA